MESKVTVNEHNTATAMGSGDLPVFATPAMVALMENAAMCEAQKYYNQQEETSVGTMIRIEHTKASPIGAEITASAHLADQHGRLLTFEVVARDENGEIGRGTHQRCIVNRVRFMSKL